MWTEYAAIQVGFATKVRFFFIFVSTNTRKEWKEFEIRMIKKIWGHKWTGNRKIGTPEEELHNLFTPINKKKRNVR
jgi:hypothetical protein